MQEQISAERVVGFAMAKLAATLVSVNSLLALRPGQDAARETRRAYRQSDVEKYFEIALRQLKELALYYPDLFDDIEVASYTPATMFQPLGNIPAEPGYSRQQLESLQRDIEHAIELRAAAPRIEENASTPVKKASPCVFLSHGRSGDWREVQAYIQKDCKVDTLELSQEPSLGSTVIEKLESNRSKCDAAVIVMSGDDHDDAGNARARENVMHEIGYFQAAYGRSNVVLLHEDGVSLPSNLSGIVYIAYPKGYVQGGLSTLRREIEAIYRPAP